MTPFNLTALTRPNPSVYRKAKTREIVHTTTLQKYPTFNHSFNFRPNQLLHFKSFSPTTAPRHFKKRAMAEMNSQFTNEEDQEIETQPIYLSSDESEIASPCSSPIPQLPNNVVIRTLP